MANTKNFGIIGIGSNVQYGKNGVRLKSNSGVLEARNAADNAYVVLRSATPIDSNDVVTLGYFNSRITGGVIYRGVVDASQTDPASAGVIGTPVNGDMYRVTTAGNTAFGFQLNVGDYVIYNGTVWQKIDSTDPAVDGTTDRISVTGNSDSGFAVDIAATYVGQTSITTLGTITTGTWNGSTIGTGYGGTGLTTIGTANQVLRVNGAGTALEYYTPSEANAFTTFSDGSNNATPSSSSDTFTFTGTDGVSAVVNATTDTLTIGLSINTLTDGTAITVDGTNDRLVLWDASASAHVQINPSQINGLIDKTRINDSGDTTYVDTDVTANAVVIGSNGDEVVVIKNTGGTANSKLEMEFGTVGEINLNATGTPTDVDIVLNPKGAGAVVIGGTAGGLIEGNAGEDLTIKAGDGTTAGDLILSAGTGTTPGKVQINDNTGAGNRLEISGNASSMTIATAGTGTNLDIVLDPKGDGLVKAAAGYDAALQANYNATTDEAFVTLGTVKAQLDTLVRRSTITTDASTTIGSALPAFCYFTRAVIKVTTAYDAGATFALKTDITNATIATDSDVDLQTIGTYIVDVYSFSNIFGESIVAEIGNSPAAGAASVMVEYKIA